MLTIPQLNLFGFQRGSEETPLGLTLGLDLSGGSHLVYDIIPPPGQTLSREEVEGLRSIVNRRVNEFGVSEASVQLLGGGETSVAERLLVQIPVQGTRPSITFRFDNSTFDRLIPNTGVGVGHNQADPRQVPPSLEAFEEYLQTDLGREDAEVVDISVMANPSPNSPAQFILSYVVNFDEIKPEVRDSEGNLIRRSDADILQERLGERFGVIFQVAYQIIPQFPDFPGLDLATGSVDTQLDPSLATGGVDTQLDPSLVTGGVDTQFTIMPIPTIEDIAAVFASAGHPEAVVETTAMFASFTIITDDLVEADLDEQGMPTAGDITLLIEELSRLGELAAFSEFGNVDYTVSGGVEEAKRLIGSTALLEFRERECGTDADRPDDLSDAEWTLQRCSNPAYYTDRDTSIEASDLVTAFYEFRQEVGHVVNLELNRDGADAFFDVTNRISQNDDLLAIYLDGRELVAPSAERPIADGRAYIFGNFSQEEARTISIQLRSGSLPASLDLVQEREVDATLGADSLQRSVIAGGIGLLMLVIFLILYYKIPGVVSSITLVFYALVLLAIFKLVPVTLTLSGAAAIILSLGFAVDANILIAERIKEELSTGRTLFSAISVGFDRAWPSIRDGNISTIIIAIVLFWFGDRFGTSVVQGFSLTLGIGILLSMFTAIFVNRMVMRLIAVGPIRRRINLFLPVIDSKNTETYKVASASSVIQSSDEPKSKFGLDILGRRRLVGYVSLALVSVSVLLIGVLGLPLGIDFSSGATITYEWDDDPGLGAVRQALNDAGHSEAVIQSASDGQYFIRTEELGEDGKSIIDDALAQVTGVVPRTLDISTVGQAIAEDTVSFSIIAVIVASIFVMLYIIWAFRSVQKSYRYALAALAAIIHDVLITIGMFVVFGQVFGSEVNTPFIVGILTVIGYSVNDTIVVFDRIRENATLVPSRSFRDTVSLSLNESLIRSLGTSVTTLIVILSMLLFGGQTLRDFLLLLTVGIIAGTYSSIFVASSILVAWEEKGWRGLIPTFGTRGTPQTSGETG